LFAQNLSRVKSTERNSKAALVTVTWKNVWQRQRRTSFPKSHPPLLGKVVINLLAKLSQKCLNRTQVLKGKPWGKTQKLLKKRQSREVIEFY
jgi:hypothetical protein